MSKLIGTNPNQVPSNADLGTAAFMDKKEFLLSKGSSLSAIDAIVPKTAVDVFIYDTTKDSDGGAWRKRTQHTSWYNEKLNTTTRGSRKEFPAVAVIVAEATKVTIYDADDINMPMWMVFYSSGAAGGGDRFMRSANTVAIHMLNSQLVWADGSYDLYQTTFINEEYWFKNNVVTYTNGYSGNISNRNVIGSIYSLTGSTGIVNRACNDVAMTVLPNAPINSATGLPVPTIAVATDGGVSVIKDNGTVVDLIRSPSAMHQVAFQGTTLHINSSSVGGHWIYDEIPSSDSTLSPADGHFEYWDPDYNNVNNPAYLGWREPSIAANYIGTDSTGGVSGLTAFDYVSSDSESSMMAWITSSYNTGWMHGNIKLATLSDTDGTNVIGSELVTNGDFSTGNLSGWTLTGDVTPSYDSGTGGAKMQTAPSVDGAIYQAITATAGVVVTWDVDANTSGYFGLVLNGTLVKDNITASGSYSTTSTISSIQFAHRGGGGGYGIIDNVSVRLAEKDRSVNGKGLQVFGTVTKNPVATGADLVAYSGFSTSNYLERPYNSDLDFGTGDFSLMCWVNTNSSANGYHETYISRAGRAFDISKTTLENYRFYITPATYISTTSINYNGWVQLVAVRKSGMGYIYVDGREEASGALATAVNSGYSDDDQLMIGLRRASGLVNPSDNSKIALARISATAPSAEQIKKIYEDEKFLFQENAKATLYGSSDAVTALAYDDDTELLHAGTSAGRSVFQGLRRIDNTTDAVGAAISASNGMVAED